MGKWSASLTGWRLCKRQQRKKAHEQQQLSERLAHGCWGPPCEVQPEAKGTTSSCDLPIMQSVLSLACRCWQGYQLSEYEGQMFLPAIVEQSGHNQVRMPADDVLRPFLHLEPSVTASVLW